MTPSRSTGAANSPRLACWTTRSGRYGFRHGGLSVIASIQLAKNTNAKAPRELSMYGLLLCRNFDRPVG